MNKPALFCDLVMKGGITSGVVYPPLINQLKSKYTFRSIGGTSAGAIAAAGAAAAELGRASGGFEKLDEMSGKLTDEGFLLGLFKPTAVHKPLFDLGLKLLELSPPGGFSLNKILPRIPLLALRHFPFHFSLGAVVGVIAALLLAALWNWVWGVSMPWEWGALTKLQLVAVALGLIIVGVVGGTVGALIRIRKIVMTELPQNFFGLSSGMGSKAGEKNTLTPWLSAYYDNMAGVAGRIFPNTSIHWPLTFGDLWNNKAQRVPLDWKQGILSNNGQPHINLKMFTSNLSQFQPYILPFENADLIFKATEFERLFPADIVAYLKAASPKIRIGNQAIELPAGYYALPEGHALPVIVATRMSLSFPILLSAIPLYKTNPGVKPGKINETDLQKQWFSDGGICSNFPIHFFDGWLPSHPTFGVNLTSMPKKAFEGNKIAADHMSNISHGDGSVAQSAIYLPKPNDAIATEWSDIGDNLLKFLGSIFTTAQVFRDNDQSVLPSYRERIVQVRLNETEGGLNLAMDKKKIEALISKGKEAGETLCDDFDFQQHQWVRFRVLSKEMEKGLTQMRNRLTTDPFYTNMGTIVTTDFPFTPDPFPSWMTNSHATLTGLNGLIATWPSPGVFSTPNLPIPEAVLRVGPKV